MKFACICGTVLSDQTDDLPYKGRLVADEDWNAFTQSANSALPLDWRLVTNIYQCPSCGRIRIARYGQVFFFEPENERVPKGILQSVYAKPAT